MAKVGSSLILDIDSSSLGTCLVQHGERPMLSKVKRVPIGSGAVRDAAALNPLIKEVLTTALAEYAKDAVSEVKVVLASPWFAANLRTLTSNSERPASVSKSTVKRVVDEYKSKERDLEAHLESVPISVVVNGYRTRLSKKLSGTSVSIVLYESTADSEGMRTITDAIHTSKPNAKIAWHTTPLVYAESIIRLTGDEHGIILDVGGEVSDVIILSKRTIGYVGSVPQGTRTIVRGVAGDKGSLADAESRLALLAKHELAPGEAEKITPLLQKASEEWQKSLQELVLDAAKQLPVPHHIFLVGERDELSWLELILESGTLLDQAHVQRSRSPTVVNPDFFKNSVAFIDGAAFDSSLALNALFFHIAGSVQTVQLDERPVLYSLT